MTRARQIADLLGTALQNTEGEMVEGALVDRWEPSENDPADNRLAASRLEELFRSTGFTEADAGQIQAALSRHDAPHEHAAHLAGRLRDFIGPLVERMLADPDARDRASGVRAAVMALPHERWTQVLADPDSPEVREAVVRALSRFRTPEVAAVLFERLRVETHRDVRHALALYDGFHLVDGAGPVLVDVMLHDRDSRVRSQVGYRMEHFGAGVVPPLIDALRDPACVRAAAMSLGQIGDLRALPALIDAWSEPRNRVHARLVEKALIGIAARAAQAAPPPMPADLADRVRALLDAWEPADWVGRACKDRGGLPLGGNRDLHLGAATGRRDALHRPRVVRAPHRAGDRSAHPLRDDGPGRAQTPGAARRHPRAAQRCAAVQLMQRHRRATRRGVRLPVVRRARLDGWLTLPG